MGRRKRCVYSLCPNNGANRPDGVFFMSLPRPRKELEKLKRWIAACGSYDDLLDRCQRYTLYICSEHFTGGKGPTKENPDPIPFEENADTLNLMGIRENQVHRLIETDPVTSTSLFLTNDTCQSNSSAMTEEILPNVEPENMSSIIKSELDSDIEVCSKDSGEKKENVENKSHPFMEVKLKSSQQCEIGTNSIHQTADVTTPQQALCFPHIPILNYGHLIITDPAAILAKAFDIVKANLKVVPDNWCVNCTDIRISVFKCNLETSSLPLIYSIIKGDVRGTLKVMGKSIPEAHPLVSKLPDILNPNFAEKLFVILNAWSHCFGFKNSETLKQVFEGVTRKRGYISPFTNEIHSNDCEIILLKNNRVAKWSCANCTKYKNSLHQVAKSAKTAKNMEKRHVFMSRTELENKVKKLVRTNVYLKKSLTRWRAKKTSPNISNVEDIDEDVDFSEDEFNFEDFEWGAEDDTGFCTTFDIDNDDNTSQFQKDDSK